MDQELSHEEMPALEPQKNTTTLIIDDFLKQTLWDMCKWTSFLAILGFVGVGLLVIFSLFFLFFSSQYSQNTPYNFSFFVVPMYALMAGISFILNLRLWQAGTKIKSGVNWSSQEDITAGITLLKTYFKTKGIIIIAVLALYVLIIAISIFVMFQNQNTGLNS